MEQGWVGQGLRGVACVEVCGGGSSWNCRAVPGETGSHGLTAGGSRRLGTSQAVGGAQGQGGAGYGLQFFMVGCRRSVGVPIRSGGRAFKGSFGPPHQQLFDTVVCKVKFVCGHQWATAFDLLLYGYPSVEVGFEGVGLPWTSFSTQTLQQQQN